MQKEGFQAFFVGGCIRDFLTGFEPKDFDIATNAKPEQIRRCFRNSRIIGRRFKLVHVYSRGRDETVEVATFRKDPRSGERRADDLNLLDDNVFGSFRQDAFRRDFGINALYFDPRSQNILDYVDGMEDIENQRLRSVGDPLIRFAEDPVRMLRAARFAAKLDYTIDQPILDAIARLKHTLINVKPRRMADEVEKLFLLGYGSKVMDRMLDLDLIARVFPVEVHCEHFLRESMNLVDSRSKGRNPFDASFLLTCFLWNSYRAIFDRLPPTNNVRENVNRAGRQVFKTVSDSINVTNHVKNKALEIWELQGRFERRPRRQIRTICAHRMFQDAFTFLQLRERVNDAQADLTKWWKQLRSGSNEQKTAMIDALTPERRKRRRKRKKSRNRYTKRQKSTD